MEDEGWKKDETPYLVFTCSKCRQYMYVKTTQKTKKCLRCGRQHKVSSIINSGEIVKGMTNAVDKVKERQNQLAVRELGTAPELRAADDFTVKSHPKKKIQFEAHAIDNDGDSDKFERLLHKISVLYTEFPFYIFEIMAENFDIPISELNLLVKTYQKKGILTRKNNLFKIIKKSKKNNK
jgi:hypothetical protein